MTVIEAESPLAKDDPECAAVVLDALVRDGVEIRSPAKVLEAATGSDIKLTIEGPGGAETIEGSHLLIAAGRRGGYPSTCSIWPRTRIVKRFWRWTRRFGA